MTCCPVHLASLRLWTETEDTRDDVLDSLATAHVRHWASTRPRCTRIEMRAERNAFVTAVIEQVNAMNRSPIGRA